MTRLIMLILYFFIVLNTIGIYFKSINFTFNNVLIKYIINENKFYSNWNWNYLIIIIKLIIASTYSLNNKSCQDLLII